MAVRVEQRAVRPVCALMSVCARCCADDTHQRTITMTTIDDSLYSRQRYVLGTEAMLRMQGARVFLSGLGALGVEVAKNVVLGGLKSITLHDTRAASHLDVGGGQFYLNNEHVRNGVNRAEASCAPLAEVRRGPRSGVVGDVAHVFVCLWRERIAVEPVRVGRLECSTVGGFKCVARLLAGGCDRLHAC